MPEMREALKAVDVLKKKDLDEINDQYDAFARSKNRPKKSKQLRKLRSGTSQM